MYSIITEKGRKNNILYPIHQTTPQHNYSSTAKFLQTVVIGRKLFLSPQKEEEIIWLYKSLAD